jgi:hypothetical protein
VRFKPLPRDRTRSCSTENRIVDKITFLAT